MAPSSFCSTSLLLDCECYDYDYDYEPVEVGIQPNTPSPTTEEEYRALSEEYWAREREKNTAAEKSSAGNTRAEGAGDGVGTGAGDGGIIQGRFDSHCGSKSKIKGNIRSMRDLGICCGLPPGFFLK